MERKKLALLRILQILQQYTDADHPMTQAEILEKLFKDYGIEMERKAVAGNLELLQDAGFEIGSIPQRGVYLISRPFEDGELQLLMDSVIFSRHIPRKSAEELIVKLREMASRHFKNSLMSVKSLAGQYQIPSPELFWTLQQLNEAMANERKVAFYYNEYQIDKQLHPVWDAPRKVNPYQIVAANNSYYLIGNLDENDGLTHFRLDKITGIEILREDRKSIRATKEGKIEIGTYLSSHPYMLEGEARSVVLRIRKEEIGRAIDAFGKQFTVLDSDDLTVLVSLSADMENVYYWALQNGDCAEVREPQMLRDRLRDTVSAMKESYLKGDADRLAQGIRYTERNGALEARFVQTKGSLGRLALPRVWRFSAEGTDIADVSFLTRYRRLKKLLIRWSPVTDLSCLSSLPELKALDLQYTPVSSLDFLRGRALEELVLAGNHVEDYSPLYEMAGLKFLYADDDTLKAIDCGRLKACFPGIAINGDGAQRELAVPIRVDPDQRFGGEYPANLLECVYGRPIGTIPKRSTSGSAVKTMLYDRLDPEGEKLILALFQKRRSFGELAKERGMLPEAVYMQYMTALKQLKRVPLNERMEAMLHRARNDIDQEVK